LRASCWSFHQPQIATSAVMKRIAPAHTKHDPTARDSIRPPDTLPSREIASQGTPPTHGGEHHEVLPHD
jgi:hypothetical protein